MRVPDGADHGLELEAFLPPAAAHTASGELAWITNDLDAAIAQARASNRSMAAS